MKEEFKSEKDRILKQFIASNPTGMIEQDAEDVEMELEYMIEEGIDLSKITVRDMWERLF